MPFELVVTVLIFVVCGLAWLAATVYQVGRSWVEKYQIAATERSILAATGSAQITRLVILLREDLNTYSRAQDKLGQIAADPRLAMSAFQAALKSQDQRMQRTAVKGLVYLGQAESVAPLLGFHRRCAIILRSEVSEALVVLAKIAPIRGEGRFFDIFRQVIGTPANEHYPVQTKVGQLERLLHLGVQRSAELSAKEYAFLFQYAIKYADNLALSENTRFRYQGEDFKRAIDSIQFQSKRSQGAWADPKQEERRKREWAKAQQAQGRRTQDGHERPDHQKRIIRDYYKTLQVDPSAEPEVIAAAYRRLAAKYHPDVNGRQDATPRMQLLNEAYAVLSNPAHRKRYDQLRTQ